MRDIASEIVIVLDVDGIVASCLVAVEEYVKALLLRGPRLFTSARLRLSEAIIARECSQHLKEGKAHDRVAEERNPLAVI